jgi:hypothetical protein
VKLIEDDESDGHIGWKEKKSTELRLWCITSERTLKDGILVTSNRVVVFRSMASSKIP